MGRNNFLTGFLLTCAILSAVATEEEQRLKRDIKYIKNLLTSTAIGFKDYVTSRIVSSTLSDKKGILYVTKQPNGSYIYHTRHHKIYLKPIAVPQNGVEIVYPHTVSDAPTVSVVESYLGTKTPEESLHALLSANNLVQSGILQPEFDVHVVPQPPHIVYETPVRHENEGIYPPQLHAPIENPPKQFVEVEKLYEAPEISYGIPLGAGPPRTSYGVPLAEPITVTDITPVKIIESVPSLLEYPPKQFIEVDKVPAERNYNINVNKVSNFPNVVMEQDKENIHTLRDENNIFSYKQVHNDGRISTYNDNKVRLRKLPIFNTIPTAYVDDGVKMISTRIQSNPNEFRGYSYKLLNSVTPNLAIKNPASFSKTPIHKYFGYNKNSDLSTEKILPGKSEVPLRQNEQTKAHYYKQIRPDGSTLYYNNGNVNKESQNLQVDIGLLENTGEIANSTKIYPTELPLEIQPNPYVNKYSYKQGLDDGVYTTYDGSKYFKLQSGSLGHRSQATPFISNPIKTSVEVFVNNQPTSHSNLSIPSSLDQQAFWYKYQLIGSTNNNNQAHDPQTQSTENKSDTNYVNKYPVVPVKALPIIEPYLPTKPAVSFKSNKQDLILENPDSPSHFNQEVTNMNTFSYVKTHNDGSVVTYDGQIPKITNSVNHNQVNLPQILLPQESSKVVFSSNSKVFQQKDSILEKQNVKDDVKRMTKGNENLESYSYVQKYDDGAIKQFEANIEFEKTSTEPIPQNSNINHSQGQFSYKLVSTNKVNNKKDAEKDVASESVVDTRQNTAYSYILIHNDESVSNDEITASHNLLKNTEADKQINPNEDRITSNNNGKYSYTLIDHSKNTDNYNLPNLDENTKISTHEAVPNKHINNKDITTKTDTSKMIEPASAAVNNDSLELNPIVVQPEVVNDYSFKQINSDGSEIKVTGHHNETVSIEVQKNDEINFHRGDIP